MQPVVLSPIPSTILVLFFILASLLLLGLIAALAFVVWKLNSVLTQYQEKIEPVLSKADSVLTLIGEKADSIGGKAESLLSQGEEMAGSVHEKVDQTATAVQRTINAPIIQANSLASAFREGWQTFVRLQQRTTIREPEDGKNQEHQTAAIVKKNTKPTVEPIDTEFRDSVEDHVSRKMETQESEPSVASSVASVEIGRPSTTAGQSTDQQVTVVTGRSR